MKAIFLITRGDAVGGASIHVKDMARHLIKDGHKAFVLVGQGDTVPALLRQNQVPYQSIPSLVRALSPLKDILALLRIIRILIAKQPDFISAHTSKAGVLGRIAGALLGIPVIYTPHCWSFADNFPNAKLYLLIERICSFLPAQVIAVSHYEQNLGIKSGVCAVENSQTIHNGMPDDNLPQTETSKQPPRLIMVARMDAQKDHQTLIQALGALSHLEWHLSLVGDGPLKHEIHTLAEHVGIQHRIDYRGYSSTVHDELLQAQIFVLVTHWESFPRSILEAMRAGLPVIATNTGGCSESVQDGKTGYITKASDPVDLTEKLKLLICDPSLRYEMGKASHQRYLEQFTFSHMYQKYLNLYKGLT